MAYGLSSMPIRRSIHSYLSRIPGCGCRQIRMGGEMDVTDRVVLVASGFGVWQAGRHLASARWADVVRVRVMGRDASATDSSDLALLLRDGTEILVDGALRGFDPFLDAARTTLGMSSRDMWIAGMERSRIAGEETVLFERYPPKV